MPSATPTLDALVAEINTLKFQAASGKLPPIDSDAPLPPVVVKPPTTLLAIDGCDNTYVVDMDWRSSSRIVQRMGFRDGIIVRFTTGSRKSPNNNPCRLAGAEYGSSPRLRIACLSDKPNDFSGTLAGSAKGVGKSLTFLFTVGPNNYGGYYPALEPNKTYYLNVKNDPQGEQGEVCDMYFDLYVYEV